jgi:osmoprotectant transport system ATP-binding protein
MIKFENVYKEYDNGHTVLKNLNLHCKEGEITVFIGPSGCGKTTTMKLINRLIEPTKGKVLVNDVDVSTISPVKLRRSIGYVIQHVGLFPHMTIADNVAVVPRLLEWEEDRIQKQVENLLDMVKLKADTYADRFPSELSGGQQQRIGVIRAFAAEQSIILMDEPFSALDPISREQLQDELIRLQKDIKKTIIFVTHDMDEALRIADKIVLMRSGEILQEGTPEEILRRPANDFVKNFIGKKRLAQFEAIPESEEVMTRKPVTILPSRGLAESIKIMERKQVDSLMVVDTNDRLQGYITIYDVLHQFRDETKRVGDIMHTFDHVISPDTLLNQTIELMDEHKLPYVPVVKDDQTLVGLVTRGTVVGHLSDIYSANGNEGL